MWAVLYVGKAGQAGQVGQVGQVGQAGAGRKAGRQAGRNSTEEKTVKGLVELSPTTTIPMLLLNSTSASWKTNPSMCL